MGSYIFKERWWLIVVLLGFIAFGESHTDEGSFEIGDGATDSNAGQSYPIRVSESDGSHPSTRPATALGGQQRMPRNLRSWKSAVTGVDEDPGGSLMESSMNNESSVGNQASGHLHVPSPNELRPHHAAPTMKMDKIQPVQRQRQQETAGKLDNGRQGESPANRELRFDPAARLIKQQGVDRLQLIYQQELNRQTQNGIRTAQHVSKPANPRNAKSQTIGLSINAPPHTNQPTNIEAQSTYSRTGFGHSNAQPPILPNNPQLGFQYAQRTAGMLDNDRDRGLHTNRGLRPFQIGRQKKIIQLRKVQGQYEQALLNQSINDQALLEGRNSNAQLRQTRSFGSHGYAVGGYTNPLLEDPNAYATLRQTRSFGNNDYAVRGQMNPSSVYPNAGSSMPAHEQDSTIETKNEYMDRLLFDTDDLRKYIDTPR